MVLAALLVSSLGVLLFVGVAEALSVGFFFVGVPVGVGVGSPVRPVGAGVPCRTGFW